MQAPLCRRDTKLCAPVGAGGLGVVPSAGRPPARAPAQCPLRPSGSRDVVFPSVLGFRVLLVSFILSKPRSPSEDWK